MDKTNRLLALKGGLIVSCQVKKDDPQYQDGCITALAKAALWGGACALRINEPENISAVRAVTDLPIIGLYKIHRPDTEVFMTPDMEAVRQCLQAGADIIAIDGTDRLIDGHPAHDIIPLIKAKYPDLLILADVRDEHDALRSIALGADIVAPTFYRFKKDAKSTDLPDWEMFARMCEQCAPLAAVFMEGKIWTPDDAIRAFHYGAYAVVIGTVITRPHLTTRRFYDHINGFKEERSLFY
ncbi:MAG: putative N-acetylmannosamine-6-phosphate 2-epimerase [Erysipelotrichaceae bacterium]|nr:putative N-acetylmannosamine-6-phosphate 2-epimerase [Erysipelotrichaceae bacterium]